MVIKYFYVECGVNQPLSQKFNSRQPSKQLFDTKIQCFDLLVIGTH